MSGTVIAPYPAPEIDFEDYAGAMRLKSTAELKRSRFVLRTICTPWMMRAGTWLARAGLAMRLPGTAVALERTVFRQFCGGTTLEEALECALDYYRHGVASILDYAAEGREDDASLDSVAENVAEAIEAAALRDEVPFVAIKVSGLAPNLILEKVAAGVPLDDREAARFDRAIERLYSLASKAETSGVSVFVDAEQSWIQPGVDQVYWSVAERTNRDRAVLHMTVQLYLRRGLECLEQAIERATDLGIRLGVKLVRGAYYEIELERAATRGYDAPVQPNKEATDRDFNRAMSVCLARLDHLDVCAATHNVESIRHMVAEMARLGISPEHPAVSSSQLLGMFDRLTYPLAARGYRALKYVPYGGVRDAFPYLLRRASENRSVAAQLVYELAALEEELERRHE